MTLEKKRGLGRGLQDLLSPSEWLQSQDIQLFYAPVERLVPNPYQPRQVFDDAQMDQLVQSVKEKGVLQPILVTRGSDPDQYQILAGERRWRAAKLASLTEVPVLLRESTPAEVLELALIENVQRRDLTCIEEAFAYQRLNDEFGLTQEEIAQRVGKSRSTVTNLIRLLQLPIEIQEDILNDKLTMGHARALLALPDPQEQLRYRGLILARHLSVRQTEQLIASHQTSAIKQAPLDSRAVQLQDTLRTHFGAKVLLRRNGDKGTISIPFRSQEEFERLLKIFGMDL